MARYPRVTEFINNVARDYPAVEVVHVRGSAPFLVWLDEYGEPAGKHALQPEDNPDTIAKLLEEKGITKDTPAPRYKKKEPGMIPETKHCVAWRQELVDGTPKHEDDKPCGTVIHPGSGVGHCECKDGKKLRVRVASNRVSFNCETACEQGHLPWEGAAEEL
eukprot:Sspe_Gene.9021::Locus_3035_Transcript_1_1_Confidence_1.000_Length_675::g.9021::m.9021